MAKSSRKGKKAWRKNVDTAEVERAAEEQSRAERQGTDVGELPDSQLYFIDKKKEAAAAPRRKAQRAKGPKLLRSQAILDASHAARPVIKPPAAKRGRPTAAAAAAGKQLAPKSAGGVQPAKSGGGSGRVYDLWGAEAPDPVRREAEADFDELAQALAAGSRTAFGIVRPSKRRKADAPSRIAAVEVDAPGCSYNPDAAQHEEMLARAVAEENAKLLDAEMRAKPPPKRVDWQPETDPLLQHQVDADWDEDEDDAEEEEGAEQGRAGGAAGPGKRQKEKKTRAQRNRQGRAKDAAAELAVRRGLKRQRRQLDALPAIQAEVAAAEAERERRKLRRAAIKAEKAASQPPRLGKLRFAPQPVQVLLSEEVSGSLRRLKGVPMLAKDRYVALQKRGVIEPRMPAGLRKRRRRKVTMSGQRGEAARVGHEELVARLRKAAL